MNKSATIAIAVGVAVLSHSPSFADPMPKELLGNWCNAPARGENVFVNEKGNSWKCDTKDRVVIRRNKIIKLDYICDYDSSTRDVTEDVAVPVHDAPLPGRIRKELCGALGQPNAGIRGDQPDTLQPAFLEMFEERAP